MKIIKAALFASIITSGQLLAQTLANYQAEVTSQGPTAYFKLDGTLEDAINPSIILESFGAGGFSGDVYRNASNSYFYVNNTDFLRDLFNPLISGGGVANSNATAKGSITLLFRTLTGPNLGGQRFLFDATTTIGMGTTNHNALALFFENDNVTNEDTNSLKLRFGDSTTTILQASNVLYNTWYYFALTYDEARVPNKAIWYLAPVGGTLSSGMTTNDGDAVAGEGTGLYIGQRADISGAFRNPGSGRIDEFAIWNRELTSTEIINQFTKLPQPAPPGASYQQVVQSQIPKYYFKLDNSLVEAMGNTITLNVAGTGGVFTADSLGNPEMAYSFSEIDDALYADQDLINGGGPGVNTEATGKGTISFQFRMLTDTNNSGQRFIFSAPGSEATSTDDNQLALFLESSTGTPNPNSLKLRIGNATKGSTNSSWADNNVPVAYPEELVPGAWYYFAITYDESRNTPEVYVYFGRAGGTLLTSTMNPANAAVVGDDGWLVLGNKREASAIVNNAFRNPGEGVIDEFAIWHDELNESEIQAQFNAMSPPSEPPTLNIALVGTDVVLSWTAQGTAGFQLESTPSLSTPSWTGAGSPTLVDDRNYITNAVAGDSKYYRLVKP